MRILLHICCANCAIYPVKVLREKNWDVSGCFFNHNIHPYQEFKRRLDSLKDYAEQIALNITYQEEYQLEEFLANVAHEPQSRCDYCYQSRLTATARLAAEQGFDAFSTSLLYSRYQQHDKIREIGEALARKFNLQFFYQDFRKGWNDGIKTSKEMNLYRQQYCGCIYSEKDRYYPRSRN